MFWLYFLALCPVALLLIMWVDVLRQAKWNWELQCAEARTILLVDDDYKVCRITERQLQRHGYRVLSAADAVTALRLAKSYPDPIDLVIADVIMPGMTGPQLAGCVRANRPLTPVILISGLAEDPGISFGGAPRMEFLSKPFEFDRLRHKVEDVLEAAHAS